jgi:RimJ/RimL family protein N-acetyltransferase
MPWVAGEPLTLEQRRTRLAEWERDWKAGGSARFAALLDGQVAGGCGLHPRGEPDTLEIGYWTHPAFFRRGLATEMARLLTDAAFAVPGIEHAEILHDEANVASAGVPRRLGFVLVGETLNARPAPAEVGIDWIWRISRTAWS